MSISLENMLLIEGSNLSKYNGENGTTNVGATNASKLHAYDSDPGYSVNENFMSDVNTAYQEYDDGTINPLPAASQLDLNGETPPDNYLDNLPAGSQIGG